MPNVPLTLSLSHLHPVTRHLSPSRSPHRYVILSLDLGPPLRCPPSSPLVDHLPLPPVAYDMASTATFVAPLTTATLGASTFRCGATAVAPSPRTAAAASSPARRARMAAADRPSPYETGAPKPPPPGPVQTPAQLAEAAAARAAAATARVAAARERVEAERAAAAASGSEPPPGAAAAASADEEEGEANEGDPYLRETMKQYVPPLVTTAFVSGCVALGEAAALVSELLPPL